MRTGRPKKPLALSDEERAKLVMLTRRRTAAHWLARRAQIVLLASTGKGNLDVAEALIAGALARKESRGGHYRRDFDKRDDKNFVLQSPGE